jgi:oligopeptide/dipeptide ABC transporter ATP-binding protein
MYAGQIVEHGAVDDIFYRSGHPYTLGLRAAMPTNDPNAEQRLTPIHGSPPDLFHPPSGCGYCARCPYAMQICADQPPALHDLAAGHAARCWLHHADNTQQVEGLNIQSAEPS